MTEIARSSVHARLSGVASEFWRDLTRDWLGSYRPELHYMRGPGPRWHEKHAYAQVPGTRRSRGQPRLQGLPAFGRKERCLCDGPAPANEYDRWFAHADHDQWVPC
jgi:hypothetical protein